jgi:hypothetical protein
MNDLELRKQALLLESEVQRARLKADLRRLEGSLGWLDSAAALARSARPWLWGGGALAGLLIARALGGGARGGSGRVFRLLRWGQLGFGLWRGYTAWRNR